MPDNGLTPPNMPWLWHPNSPVGQPNGLGPPMLNYAAPPDATTGQGADVLAGKAQQAWQWLQDQRAESTRQGLLDPDTGLPTQKGVVQGARATAEGVMMGTTAPGDVPPPGIVVYHGSPHSFDQFDTSKIGTGEGAQAYGHGLYFAEGEGVARQYRDQLAGKNVGFEWNGQPVPPGQPAYDLIDTLGNQDWRLGKIAEQAAKYGPRNAVDTFEPHTRNASDGPEWQAAMDQFKQGAGKSATGHMYEVNIGADPEHFLDWDKPLSEQSQHVQDALGKVSWTEPYLQSGKFPGSQIVPTTPEGAQQLKEAGVAGIRYLDQGSRTARDPIKLVEGKPYDPSDPTHIASHAIDMASGDRTAAAAIADRHAQLRAAEGDTAGADAMRQASTLLQSPRTIPPMTEGRPPGTHNYVVFDAATIDILRKYGIAGLIAGGGAAAAATQQQQPSQ